MLLEASYGAYLGVWPLWIERLGAPVVVIGIMLGAGGIVRLFFMLPAAWLAERFGLRRVLLAARGIAALGMISAGLATHWWQLAFMVVGSAFGEIAFPLANAYVAGKSKPEDRMRAFALIFTIGPSIALAAGPLMAGLFVHQFGVRSAFFLAAATTILSLIYFARIHPDDGMSARRSKSDSGYGAVWQDGTVRLLVMLLLVAVFALSLGTAFIPTFLHEVRGMSEATIATMGAAAAVGSMVFGLMVARVRRFQRAPLLAVAVTLLVSGIGFLLFQSSVGVGLILLAFFFRGGFFSSWAMLSAAVGDSAPAAIRTRAFALAEMVAGLAFACGPFVGGPLYKLGPSVPILAGAGLVFLLAPFMLVAHRRSRYGNAKLAAAHDAAQLSA